MSRRARTVIAYDTPVRMRRPLQAALLCLLTGGLFGIVHQLRISREIAAYGRARGRMPFAFTPLSPGASALGWATGLGAWYLLVVVGVAYLHGLLDGAGADPDDVTGAATLLLLLAPLWLVALHTTRRIRTVQHLAGVDGPYPSAVRGALAVALLPPLGTWHVQRQLNRAWAVYR